MIFMGREVQTLRKLRIVYFYEVKTTFKSFIEKGEIPNLLLSGTAGVGKTTIAKHCVMNWGLIVMSLMGLMKVDSWTLYAIRQRPLLVLFLLHLAVVIKFLLLMKQTIRHPMYNSSYVPRLKSSRRTVGSYSRVTLRIK